MSFRPHKKAKATFKAILGIGLLTFLVIKVNPQKVFNEFSSLDMFPITLAFLAQLTAKFIWTFRWKEILDACGITKRFGELFIWLFIGLFFNCFLPTAVGGDIVRGYYAGRDQKSMAPSMTVLLIERILGLTTLAALAAATAIVVILKGGSQVPFNILMAVFVLGTLLTIAGALLFSWQGWLDKIKKLSSPARPRLARMKDNLIGAMVLFNRPSTPKLRIVTSSMILQVVAVLFYIACARAVGLDTPATLFFFIVPASVVVAMLPLSLNGIGIREGVLVGLLVAQGASDAKSGAFAFLALIISTFFSLLGGLIYLGYHTTEDKYDMPTNS